jgi:hypothetical protein
MEKTISYTNPIHADEARLKASRFKYQQEVKLIQEEDEYALANERKTHYWMTRIYQKIDDAASLGAEALEFDITYAKLEPVFIRIILKKLQFKKYNATHENPNLDYNYIYITWH